MKNSSVTAKDRHSLDSVQFKAWVPAKLRNDFSILCATQGVTPSAVLRELLIAYLAQAESRKNG